MPAVAEKPEVIEAVTIDPQAMPAVKYSPTDAELAKLRSQYEPLIADPDAAKSKEGYERCRLALQTLTPLRTGVNRMRLAANDGAQRFIKRNNELAADITAKIEAMETPIWEKKKAVDEEKERQKKAEAEAERAKIEAEIKAKRDAEEAKLKAIREAEGARLAEERKVIEAEKKRLADEREADLRRQKLENDERARLAKIDEDRVKAEQQAILERLAEVTRKQEAERAEIAKQQLAIKAEQDRLAKIESDRLARERAEKEAADRAEFERKAREKAEADAKIKAEADRVAAEKAKTEKAEAERIEAERIATARPDVEKIIAFGKELVLWLQDYQSDFVKSPHAKEFLNQQIASIRTAADACRSYTTPKKAVAR